MYCFIMFLTCFNVMLQLQLLLSLDWLSLLLFILLLCYMRKYLVCVARLLFLMALRFLLSQSQKYRLDRD